MDLEVGIAGLDRAQDRADGVVALVEDTDAQGGRGQGHALREHRGPVDVGEDLAGLDQEAGAGRGEGDVPGGAVDQQDADGSFEALDLGAERGRDDVLPGRGATEMQFLGKGDEVAQLTQLDAAANGVGNGPDHHDRLLCIDRRLRSVIANIAVVKASHHRNMVGGR